MYKWCLWCRKENKNQKKKRIQHEEKEIQNDSHNLIKMNQYNDLYICIGDVCTWRRRREYYNDQKLLQ